MECVSIPLDTEGWEYVLSITVLGEGGSDSGHGAVAWLRIYAEDSIRPSHPCSAACRILTTKVDGSSCLINVGLASVVDYYK